MGEFERPKKLWRWFGAVLVVVVVLWEGWEERPKRGMVDELLG